MDLNRNKRIDKLLFSSTPLWRVKTSDKRGQQALDELREVVSRSIEDEDDTGFSPEKEYWVRYYLEEYGEAYGIELVGDLDEEIRGTRGDYRVLYKGDERVLEVEKDLKEFFRHGHETGGTSGWESPESIDLVFATTDTDGRADELDIPVIIAASYDSENLDAPTFSQWYSRVNSIKSRKEALVFSLLAAVYWNWTKGIPTESEVERHTGEVDEVSRAYLSAAHEALWSVAGWGVNTVLFEREEAVSDDEEFVDLKELVTAEAQAFDRDGECGCPVCGDPMVAVGSSQWVYESDVDEMTEGQLAEQMAAEMGGPFEEGVHGETLSVEYCFKCLIAAVYGQMDSNPLVFDNRSEVEFKD